MLPAWDRDNPLKSFVLGLYAFGLEETGDLKRAEDFGREALAHNRRDAWATHALAHVMETANRHEEGVAFLKSTRTDGRRPISWPTTTAGTSPSFLSSRASSTTFSPTSTASRRPNWQTMRRSTASMRLSLLWRLELAGVDVGNRWAPVADTSMAHVDDHLLAFNDLHCAFAAARSHDPDHVVRFTRSLDDYERLGQGDNRLVTVEVGRRLIDGVLAFAGENFARAVEAILPVRKDAVRVGGSHAQRDIVNLTLIAAAERSGQRGLARALLNERAGFRPTPRT